MSGYVRELVIDVMNDRTSVETRVDFQCAIKKLSKTTPLLDLTVLLYFAFGYSVSEITKHIPITEIQVKDILSRLFLQLELYTNYTDTDFALHYEKHFFSVIDYLDKYGRFEISKST